MTTNLPIDAVLDEVRTTLLHSPNLLLIAEPGAGKTTRVPLALLDQPWLHGKRIIMLEPRRVAARNAALFMAAQLNENVGQRVGYRMRLEHKVSASTRIEVVTEGILTNMLQDDPALSNVGLVIFDEFHERHLASDLGLALCLQSQQLFNDQLRLLVMSATLDESALLTIMDAQVIRSPGRGFPITTFYRPAKDANERLTAHLSRVLSEALQNSEGDVLVFLPGTADIRHAQNHLASFHPNCVVLPLHGQLSDRDQKQALQPDTQQLRKIILSTNLAESALTIDGVSIVIDSGLERRLRFKPSAGLSELVTQGISCASATQREGRAGRQSPGTCYRLYSDTQLQQRPDHIRP
ncbi:MAG: helicase-related protein, partial [Oleibacter sp.]|nr:helicase-related protein [Thalassolituus sp.]